VLLKRFLASSLLLGACGSQVEANPTPQTPASVATSQSQPVTKPVEKKTVVVIAGGDVIPHGSVKTAAERHSEYTPDNRSTNNGGYDKLFEKAHVAFKDADIGFVNLETPIAPTNDNGSRSMVFNAPPELLVALKNMGVNIVSFANNHIYDQGRKGFTETLDNLDAVDLLFAGAGRNEEEAFAPTIIEKAGMKICFFAGVRLMNVDLQPKTSAEPQVVFFHYDKKYEPIKQKFLKSIKDSRATCDFIFASMHWGAEYVIAPSADDAKLAKEIVEAGADGVLGHHPHVLQPLQKYTTKDGRETFLCYSMGNFISSQTALYTNPTRASTWTRDSMVLRVVIERNDAASGPKGVLKELGYYPAWTDRDKTPAEKDTASLPIIRPVLIEQEIADAEAAIKALDAKGELTPEEQADKKSWKNRIALMQRQKEELTKIVGKDFVLPLPK
jgi:poly-gamma-glutamate capsule biosynthesis protein CapA/YwtB (metallophosphatase superfamily)